jgi:hypothetical protein
MKRLEMIQISAFCFAQGSQVPGGLLRSPSPIKLTKSKLTKSKLRILQVNLPLILLRDSLIAV